VVTRQVTLPAQTHFRDSRQQPRPCLEGNTVQSGLVEFYPESCATQQPDPQVAHRNLMVGEVFAGGQLGPLDQRQRLDSHRDPDRDPGGQARGAWLVPHRQIPVRRQQAHDLLGSAHLGKRLAYPELKGRPQSRAVRGATVIEVGAGSDVGKPAPLGKTAHRGEHGPFTEVAAIAGIGPVAGVDVLIGAQHHQFRPNLPGDALSTREFGACQAGRVGDGGQHGIGAERPDGRSQHHGGVDPAREGHHQPVQPSQPVEQSRRSIGGADEICSVHGRRSSHVRGGAGSREIVGAVVDSAPQPPQDPSSNPGQEPAGAAGTGDRIGEIGDIARLDLDRRRRTAVPEVVFADGKTEEQTLRLLAAQRRSEPGFPALATRCPDGVLRRAPSAFPAEPVVVDLVGRTVIVGALPPARGFVAVLTGGTSDLPVAREAIATLQALGAGHRLIADVGVAGLHRLLLHIDELSAADCVIAIAGMEGTLPVVVTGLIRAPVVGVPTSVGYGVSAGGYVAAAAMLATCAPGLSVVNIDNGFGAAAHAVKIVARVHGG
jgi:pyridinium-3,5-biscarboxylic acid mononucleotide synthase